MVTVDGTGNSLDSHSSQTLVKRKFDQECLPRQPCSCSRTVTTLTSSLLEIAPVDEVPDDPSSHAQPDDVSASPLSSTTGADSPSSAESDEEENGSSDGDDDDLLDDDNHRSPDDRNLPPTDEKVDGIYGVLRDHWCSVFVIVLAVILGVIYSMHLHASYSNARLLQEHEVKMQMMKNEFDYKHLLYEQKVTEATVKKLELQRDVKQLENERLQHQQKHEETMAHLVIMAKENETRQQIALELFKPRLVKRSKKSNGIFTTDTESEETYEMPIERTGLRSHQVAGWLGAGTKDEKEEEKWDDSDL